MNPRNSLMGFLVLLIVSGAPAAAKVPADWVGIQAGGIIYYLSAAKYQSVVDQGGGSRELYNEARKEVATLEVEVVQGQPPKLTVKPHDAAPGAPGIPGDLQAGAPAAPAQPSAAAASEMEACQKDVEPKLCEMVLNSPSLTGAPSDIRLKVAKAFKLFRRPESQKEFSAIYRGKVDRDQAFAAAALAIINDNGGQRPEAAFPAFAKSGGAAAAPAELPAQVAPPVAMPSPPPAPEGRLAPGQEQSAGATPYPEVEDLAKLLAAGPAREAASNRIAAYLTHPKDESRAFFAIPNDKDMDPGKLAQYAKQLKAQVKALVPPYVRTWVARTAADPAGAKAVATLYFVIGDDPGRLAWAEGRPLLVAFLTQSETPYRLDFDKRMELWMPDAARAKKDNPRGTYQGPLANVITTDPPPGQHSLDDILGPGPRSMVDQANEALLKAPMDPEKLREKIRGQISSGAQLPGLPSVPANPSQPGGGTGPIPTVPLPVGDLAFGYNDLYVNGALVVKVHAYGQEKSDAEDCCRTLSLKIYTKIDDKGQAVNELGVFDISEPAGSDGKPHLYGRRFPIDTGDSSPFTLKEGGIAYMLSITGGAITFGRADGVDKATTSQADLLKKRSDEARERGQTTWVGNQKYRVLGQGGQYGTFLYFPADASGQASGNNDLPALIAAVNHIGSSGLPEALTGKLKIQNNVALQKEPVHKYLEYNGTSKKLEMKDGDGDVTAFALDKKDAEEKTKKEAAAKKAAAKAAPKGAAGEGDASASSAPGETPKGDNWTAECGDLKVGELDLKKFTLRSGWTVGVDQKDGDGAVSVVCINKDQGVYLPGFLPFDNGVMVKTIGEKQFLVINAVQSDKFVPLDKLHDGQVQESQIPGGATADQPSFPSRWVHYLPTDKLSTDDFEKAKNENHGMGGPERIAAFSAHYLQTMTRPDVVKVFVRSYAPNEAEGVKTAVTWAVENLAKGSDFARRYRNPDNAKIVDAFIDRVVQKADSFKREDKIELVLDSRPSDSNQTSGGTIETTVQAVRPSWVGQEDWLYYCGAGKTARFGSREECGAAAPKPKSRTK